MCKEYDEILRGIHRCFADFNGGIVEGYKENKVINEINITNDISEINRRLQFRESTTNANDNIDIYEKTEIIDKQDYIINNDKYKVIKIMLPSIELPEIKVNMCKKNIEISENKIDDLCKEIKALLNKRYFLDEEEVTFFDSENEEWRKISIKDPMKCIDDMSKLVDKGVKETSNALKTSFDNMKCNIEEMGKGIDKTVKNTVKKGSSKIQPVVKAQTDNLNNKIQESYEDLLKQLEMYKKKVEDNTKKLKKSTAELSVKKELLDNIGINLEKALKTSLKSVQLLVPCIVIRKNTVLAGIEVKYPREFDNIIQTALYLAGKIAKGEMMEVVLLKVKNILLNAKEDIKEILREAINVGIKAFIDSIKKSLELMNNKLINVDELIFNEINTCKSSDWLEVKYDFTRGIEILNEY